MPQMQTQTLNQPAEIFYTLKEACLYLRCSRSTLYRLLTDGQLKGHKVGYTWRFELRQLKECVRPIEMEGQIVNVP